MMIFAGYFKKVFEIIRQEQEAISIKAAPLKIKMSKNNFSNISFLTLISDIYIIQRFRVSFFFFFGA